MPSLPSKKQIEESKPKFPLIPQEDYILKIESLEPNIDWNWDHTEEVEKIKATFSIVSLKDGTLALDEVGKPLHEKRRMIRDFEESRMGFTQEGIPSLTRQFVAYMLGVNPFAEDESFDFEWKQFVGKTIGAKIVQYMVKKGKNAGSIANKIDSFLPPKKKSFAEQIDEPVANNSTEDIPVIEDDIDVKDIPF